MNSMNPLNEPDPGAHPIWKDLGHMVGHMTQAAGSSIGMLCLEKDGGAALLIAGPKDQDNAHILKCLKLFQERLADVIAKTETQQLDIPPETQCYLHDHKTGQYRISPGFNREQN